MKYKTAQENFWAGEFMEGYISRNSLEGVPNRISMFSRILSRTSDVKSVIELGANIGINLHALHALLPKARLEGVEINEKAVAELKKYEWITTHHASLLEYQPKAPCDMSFTSGVLIHINPEELPRAYETLYKASRRYICVCEYFNPSPVTIPYRGEEDRLFKRDFAGEIMDAYPGVKLVDYGFVYKRDPNFPADNINWFLLEK